MTDFKFNFGLWDVVVTCERKETAIEMMQDDVYKKYDFKLIDEKKAS